MTTYTRVQRSMLRCGRTVGLTLDGIWLYSRLLDRCTLSARNGYADARGRVYVFCSRESAAALIGCSIRKAGTLLRQLSDCGLIRVEQARNGRRLYVRQWCAPSPFHPLRELVPNGWLDVTLERVDVMPEDYITVDAAIADSDLSTRAKLLYAMLADESAEQELYGRDVCAIPREEAMELLHCTRDTLRRVYAELERAGSISRSARQGYGKQRAVSVAPSSGLKIAPQWAENCTSVGLNLPSQWAENCTQTNLSNPSFLSQPSSASLCTPAPAGEQEAPVREKERIVPDMEQTAQDIQQLRPAADAQAAVDAVAEVISADAASTRRTYTIGTHRNVPRDELLAAYSRIDRWTLATLVCKLADNWDRIKDRTRYIRAVLYAADKHAGEAYYTRMRLTAA